MDKYKTIFFDLDDTLINNTESVRYAFNVLIEELGINYSDELFEKWLDFDQYYWHDFENGKIIFPNYVEKAEDKLDYLRANRFLVFFKEKKLDIQTASVLNKVYCANLSVNIVEIEGAKALLEYLHQKYELIIATNGPKIPALEKLKKVGIEQYFKEIVSSDEVGFSKPTPQYFNYLFSKASNKDKNKMLIIGDTLTKDVLGGNINGIDSCWYNPYHKPETEDIIPTINISQLLQLTDKI